MLKQARLEVQPDGQVVRVARLGRARGVPVILLHGYPDNLQLWSRVATRLAGSRQVIAFDWPGMGDSTAWPGGTTPQHQAERLITLLDRWGIARADLVAMDMGGQPALVAAARHPQRVRTLTVMNSLVLAQERTSWDIELLRRYGWNRWLLRRLPRAVFSRAWMTSMPRGAALTGALRDELWRCFARPEVRSFIIRLCAGYQGSLPALPEIYRTIACPTLILWGGRDAHFPTPQARGLQRLIDGARYQLVAGGGHWMAWHQSAAVASAILRFIAEQSEFDEGSQAGSTPMDATR